LKVAYIIVIRLGRLQPYSIETLRINKEPSLFCHSVGGKERKFYNFDPSPT